MYIIYTIYIIATPDLEMNRFWFACPHMPSLTMIYHEVAPITPP